MEYEAELVQALLRALQEADEPWTRVVRVVNRDGSKTSLDLGAGRFWDVASLSVQHRVNTGQNGVADFLLSVEVEGETTSFLGETRDHLSPGRVADLGLRLEQEAAALVDSGHLTGRSRMLVLARRLSDATRQELHRRGISYFDSSGNLLLLGNNFLLQLQGKGVPAEVERRGGGALRLDSPKVSRVVRAVLTGFQGGVRDLAGAVKVDPGYVSRVLSSLARVGYLRRHPGKSLLEVSYSLEDEARGELLDAWASSRRPFWRKRELYRVPAPDPSTLESTLENVCREARVRYAFTLWGAANRFARITTVPYVAFYCDEPWKVELRRLGAKAVADNANLWLMHPRDEGVFHFSVEQSGTSVVHPVQLYYDLMHAPHRGISAAQMLREAVLGY